MKDPRKIIDLKSIKMIDMHAHVMDMGSEGAAFSEIAYRKKAGIFSVYCCRTPEEWSFLTNLGCLPVSAAAMLSFGIHPWESDKYDPYDCMEMYEAAPLIGEIGLDSVWTDIPHAVQLAVFRKQLKIAETLKKPVILHTKGCEAETAELIKDFSQPVLIHWYSGDNETLNRFIDMGCYFTMGPDTICADHELISAMLGRIPRERLFAETDGLESIFWVKENHPDFSLSLPEADFAGTYAGIGANKDYPLIFESLYTTLKYLSDYDCVDIRSTAGQNVSGLMEFAFSNIETDGKCLIISGGERSMIPTPHDYDLIIAADKGLQYALDAGVQPHMVIGDFDSFEGDVQSAVREASAIRLPVRKNDSDSQSAVKYALEHGYRDITFCCIMGGRLDHMIANIQTASHAAKKGALCTLLGETDEVYVFTGRKLSFPRREGWSVSVFALSDRCDGIDITGALYTVSDFSLTNDLSRGLSNEWASDCIEISVKSGILAVILSDKRR